MSKLPKKRNLIKTAFAVHYIIRSAKRFPMIENALITALSSAESQTLCQTPPLANFGSGTPAYLELVEGIVNWMMVLIMSRQLVLV